MSIRRVRLDHEMVRRGLVDSRSAAKSAIEQGKVLVSGTLATRPARLVAPGDPIRFAEARARFVGRGGDKLAAALERFNVTVEGASCLDVGASTGGFTDCLLQHGARSVVALDVGHGQLDDGLRRHRRVLSLERTNVRSFTFEQVAKRRPDIEIPFDLVAVDVSFTSLREILGPLLRDALVDGGSLIALVKPQFEVGRVEASRGRGVITDPSLWADAIDAAVSSCEEAQAAIMDVMASPLLGGSGNREFLLHAKTVGSPPVSSDRERWRAAAFEGV